ncbi:MAG TPA: MOSC N-terminal beta barrel domain-containing protein [Acidimicrobiales bacterium]|nr:MOSC N-terminal beta barrel domain-containing protein [Acidimicrobiales bacterium]
MHVVGLWRYPVKSMQGEALDAATVIPTGIAGDRRWGVQSIESQRVLSAKREGRLLEARGETADPVLVTLPTGERLAGPGPAADAALTAWLGRPVRLAEAGSDEPTFESQSDYSDDESDTVTWDGRPGSFVDSSPVHLVTTATLRAMGAERPDLDWQLPRFRPNLVVDAPGDERVEDGWVGRRCTVGEVELLIVKPCTRCVMVTRRQPGAQRQPEILSHLTHTAAAALGVLGRVVRTGAIGLGDAVDLA